MAIIFDVDNLVLDDRAREWCRLPYPDHPRGCPNYGHKVTCPPDVCCIGEFMDLSKRIQAVVEPFDLLDHIIRMQRKHPRWSARQCKCVLYWQGRVNKRLDIACRELLATITGGVYTICPEAMGVDVIHTIRRYGIPIHPRPVDWVFKVGFVGVSPK